MEHDELGERNEQVLLLELILTQLERRDEEESAREEIANAKLTSMLTVAPIIVTLSTTAFVPFVQFTKDAGGLGIGILWLFVIAIGFFIAATLSALLGLRPQRSQYAAIGLRTINALDEPTTRESKLHVILSERTKCVRANRAINSTKFGYYTRGVNLLVVGLISVAAIVLSSVILLTSRAFMSVYSSPSAH
jgi:hypothetical protein